MTQIDFHDQRFTAEFFGSYGSFSLLPCYFPFSQLLQHGVTLLHNNSMYIVFYAFKLEMATWRLTSIANIMTKQHCKIILALKQI